MRFFLLILCVSVASGVVSAQGDRLDDGAVQAALDAGLDKDRFDTLTARCTAKAGFGERLAAGLGGTATTYTGGYLATFASPAGQLAMLTVERQRRYLPVPPISEIGDDLRQRVLRVWLEPRGDADNKWDDQIDLSASIQHVVIRPEGRKDDVVQPVSVETEPVAFTNLFGAEFTSTRALATFPAAAALEAATDRDLEVVVITTAGERRCNVDNDDIRRMFQTLQ